RSRADVDDLDVEQLLDRLADLRLVRAVVHAECVLAGLGEHERLLGDDRADDHLRRIHQPSSPSSEPDPLARATSSAIAACETSNDAAPTTSATPASPTGITSTRARLRNDLPASASSSDSSTSQGPLEPQSASKSAASAVEGPSKDVASNTASDSRPACSDSAPRIAARRALRLTLKV